MRKPNLADSLLKNLFGFTFVANSSLKKGAIGVHVRKIHTLPKPLLVKAVQAHPAELDIPLKLE